MKSTHKILGLVVFALALTTFALLSFALWPEPIEHRSSTVNDFTWEVRTYNESGDLVESYVYSPDEKDKTLSSDR